jgi:hypothetical protein
METYDLIKCVDRALDEYGSSAKQAVYLTLSLKKSASFEEVVLHDPAMLVAVLHDVFDESSEIVKRSIIAEIKAVFGLKKPCNAYQLEDALGVAFRRLSGVSPLQVTA